MRSWLSLPPAADDHVIALHVYVVALQRPRRRTADVAPRQVVHAVVARAPDLVEIVAVLHGAAQVRARSRHRLVLAVGGADQESGAAAEAEHLGRIRL